MALLTPRDALAEMEGEDEALANANALGAAEPGEPPAGQPQAQAELKAANATEGDPPPPVEPSSTTIDAEMSADSPMTEVE